MSSRIKLNKEKKEEQEEKIIEIETPGFNPNNLVIWSLYDLNKN